MFVTSILESNLVLQKHVGVLIFVARMYGMVVMIPATKPGYNLNTIDDHYITEIKEI